MPVGDAPEDELPPEGPVTGPFPSRPPLPRLEPPGSMGDWPAGAERRLPAAPERGGAIGATTSVVGAKEAFDTTAGGAGGSWPGGARLCQRSRASEAPGLAVRNRRDSRDSTEQASRRWLSFRRSPLFPPPLPESTLLRHGSLPDEVKRLKQEWWSADQTHKACLPPTLGRICHRSKGVKKSACAFSAFVWLVLASGLRPLSIISMIGSTPSREDRSTLVFDPGLSEPRTVNPCMTAYPFAPTWGGWWGSSPSRICFFHELTEYDFQS